MKIINGILVLLAALCSITSAQENFEDWQKKEQEKLNKYISEQDSKFVDFLKKEWKSQDIKAGIKPFEKPKPKLPHVVIAPKETPLENNNNEKADKPQNNKAIEPQLPAADYKKEDDIQFNLPLPKKHLHKLEFFSLLLPVSYSSELAVPVSSTIDNETIAEYWKNISSTNYKECLEQAIVLRDKLKLNDWGYAKLLYETGNQLNKKKMNESYLFTWFMLVKSGYKARVGYDNNKVYLLIPSENKLFGVPFFSFKDADKKFYVLSFDNKNITTDELYTYNEDYPDVDKYFSFTVKQLPDLGQLSGERKIKFNYRGKENIIPFRYNTGLVKYFEYYPYTDLQVYFSSQLSNTAEGSLVSSLKQLTKNMAETEALNFLLRFVQYATDYKIDNEQFGFEKPLFPEESLFYKFSDCEDRSIFFSYIVRKVLGLKVVGLDYPDHIATAVKLHSPFDGDKITYHNDTYLICDPTYIGASIGTAMPAYKDLSPGIIESF